MRYIYAALLFLISSFPAAALADVVSDIQTCAAQQRDNARLACYDQLASSLSTTSPGASTGNRATPLMTPAPAAPRVSPSSTPSRSYGASCPCGSGSVCTGPRGGRYCITSGGNKRYGQ